MIISGWRSVDRLSEKKKIFIVVKFFFFWPFSHMVLRKDIKELDADMDQKADASLKPGVYLHCSHSYPFH